MGTYREELRETMWDSVYCDKHGTTMPDRRFECPKCEIDRKKKLNQDKSEARDILHTYGLSYLIT